jgi:hypothetical protein
MVARRNTKRAFERAAEVARAEVQKPGELSNGNPSGEIGFHVGEDSARLPRRETSPYDGYLQLGEWMDAIRIVARISAQERDGVLNVRRGRFAVTFASTACSFNEQCHYGRQLLGQRFVHRCGR